jgi:putative NADPH-quinone reductase
MLSSGFAMDRIPCEQTPSRDLSSDLHEMRFDPVSSRKNFTTVQDPSYFKQQIGEMYATEMNGFSEEIESEIRNIEWCDLMIWQSACWYAPAVSRACRAEAGQSVTACAAL